MPNLAAPRILGLVVCLLNASSAYAFGTSIFVATSLRASRGIGAMGAPKAPRWAGTHHPPRHTAVPLRSVPKAGVGEFPHSENGGEIQSPVAQGTGPSASPPRVSSGEPTSMGSAVDAMRRQSNMFYLQMATQELEQHKLRVEQDRGVQEEEVGHRRAPVLRPMVFELVSALLRFWGSLYRTVVGVVWALLHGNRCVPIRVKADRLY